MRWTDGRGDDVIGFSVLRVRRGTKHRIKISKRLIPAGSLATTEHFRFVDRYGRRGERYFVRATSADGTTRVHGPFVA